DASYLDQVALTGALASAFAVVELFAAAVVVGLGAGGLVHVAVLLAVIAAAAAIGVGFHPAHRRWVAGRPTLTPAVIPDMIGNRTRVGQQTPEAWHLEEDALLDRLAGLAHDAERFEVALRCVGRAWLLAAMATLGPAFIAGVDPGALAVGVGGTLLAFQAF